MSQTLSYGEEPSRRSAPIPLNTTGFAFVPDDEDSAHQVSQPTVHPATQPAAPGATHRVEGHTITWVAQPERTPEAGYEDRDLHTQTHGVRFRRDTILAFGRHEAARVNRHGVPVFSPGWSAGRAAWRAWLRTIIAALTSAGFVALAIWLYAVQAGTDPVYNRLAAEGIHTTAHVSDVATGRNPAGLNAEVVTADWTAGGRLYGQIVIDTTSSPLPDHRTWSIGQPIEIMVDPADHTVWKQTADAPWPRFNILVILPLLAAGIWAIATGAAGWLAARLSWLGFRTWRDEKTAENAQAVTA